MTALLASIDPWSVIPSGGATAAVIFCIWLNNKQRSEDRRELIAALDRQSAAFEKLADRISDLTLEVRTAHVTQPKGGGR